MQDMPLMIAISTLLLSLIIESLYLFVKPAWIYKSYFASVSMFLSAFAAGILVAQKFNFISILILFITFFRVINSLRIVENRMNEEHLKKVVKKSFLILALLQSGMVLIYIVNLSNKLNLNLLFNVYILVALIVSILLLINTIYLVNKTAIKRFKKYTLEDLPTVTLAIPARNEDYALKTCLEAAIASDYPKLEIIVIDDCSQDKTPNIIKEFAHQGVRFIQASESEKSWLAKNKAYQTLYEQSSGQIIMFMGVDVFLSPTTITCLTSVFMAKKCMMLSAMPARIKNSLVASMIQPMRYWRELAIPYFVKKRPPVLSTCWLIDKKTLKDIGEFKSLARTVTPEEHFAKELKSKYLFIRAGKLGLTTQKDFISQWQTATRTHYPEKHKRPESVMVASLGIVAFLIAPYIFLVFFALTSLNISFCLLLLSCICLTASNCLINLVSNRSAFWLSIVNFPFVAMLDLAAMVASMYLYEFKEVIWRGRNITGPTMHVYTHLPKIS